MIVVCLFLGAFAPNELGDGFIGILNKTGCGGEDSSVKDKFGFAPDIVILQL